MNHSSWPAVAFMVVAGLSMELWAQENSDAPGAAVLERADYGYLLDREAGLWWAEATYKISRDRPLPEEISGAVRLSAARNEYEPVQLVLRPPEGLQKVTVAVEPFRNGEHVIGAEQVTVRLVGYVRIEQPTDTVGARGWWPDPLLPIGEENLAASLDFSAFDRAAERYLDAFGFNGFRLGLKGMGGGSFHSRRCGKLGPHEQGTPEYEALFHSYVSQLEAHLRQKGWLEKAYVYWFDEPDPKDYDFVIEGMELIHRHAPGLRRMLTEQPERKLYGHVDLWCPVTYSFMLNHRRVKNRMKKGDPFWWYLCTSPRGEFATLFIDHHAVELRLWLWQTWKYRVKGILIWQTNYWTSRTAFPGPERQNPYEDPMSYQSGYGPEKGEKGYWGNGDGRFFYPPAAALRGEKSLEGPVDSLRWELLREGIEDYLYFWMLAQEVLRLKETDPDSADLEAARRLLRIPQEIVGGMTDFTKDPKPIYEHRRLLAERLEAFTRH